MRISKSAVYAVGVIAAAAMLAACGGGSTSSGSSGIPSGTGLTGASRAGGQPSSLHSKGGVPIPAAVKSVAFRGDHHKSWVSPDVNGAPRILFESDYAYGDIYMFKMPSLALKGTLTGFSEPEGLCNDKSGNIWVSNTAASEMVQLSRTGATLNTLSDPGQYPAACSVNPANGDLGVANIETTEGGPGSVSVYANASGSPTTYALPNGYTGGAFNVAYDPSGNLYFDGEQNPTRTASFVAELPNGSGSTRALSVSGGTLYFAGMIQWYPQGGYLALGDQECGDTFGGNCIYWATVSGSTATITGTTVLNAPTTSDFVGGWIGGNGGKLIVGGAITETSSPSTVNRFAFPAGGSPTNSVVPPTGDVIGAAVSTK